MRVVYNSFHGRAADVLVTDCPSVMFDYAITARPIVFYAYDLDRFRDSIRGFYFDLMSHAPGPVVETQDELLEALGDLSAIPAEHADDYATLLREHLTTAKGMAREQRQHTDPKNAPSLRT